jgi:signal transduction histidine kinase
LQATDQVLHRERFCLDELVTDAVQKFDVSDTARAVTLGGVPPGRLAFHGDLQLIERALTNLIDNALRHAPGSAPVCVSVRRDGARAEIWVEDAGPGLPGDVHERLDTGQPLREPPLRRSSGGIGGLGLAIAQRVAVLHGGSLRPLPTPHGGTRLCLALPLAG